MARPPKTIFEAKVNFPRIERRQNARHQAMLNELRKVLHQMERRTVQWALENLANKKLRLAVNKFELPLKGKYQAVVRQRITAAALAGTHDVAEELDKPVPKLKVADLTRYRQSADALSSDHLTRLESDLRRVWADAMHGPISRSQIVYVTKKTFADFAGWEPPGGPENLPEE